jgi:hypothetical protein
LGTSLIKLVNENKIDWDDHLPVVFFFYTTTYKVAKGYKPYQLVYGLDPLMPTKYILPVIGSNHKKGISMVLTSRVSKLK